MAARKSAVKDMDDGVSKINKAIPFLLAGIEGHTDGVELFSISIQRVSDGGFRVVLRGESITPDGHPLRVVSFTHAEFASEVCALTEDGYRENVIRWHIDRYAKGASDNGRSKTGGQPLTIVG